MSDIQIYNPNRSTRVENDRDGFVTNSKIISPEDDDVVVITVDPEDITEIDGSPIIQRGNTNSPKVKEKIAKGGRKVASNLKKVGGQAARDAQKVGRNIAKTSGQAVRGAVDITSSAIGAAGDTIEGASKIGSTTIRAAGKGAKDIGHNLAKTGGQVVSGASDIASSTIGAAGDTIEGLTKVGSSTIRSAGKGAKDIGSNLAKSSGQAIRGAAGITASTIGAAGDTIDGLTKAGGSAIKAAGRGVQVAGHNIANIGNRFSANAAGSVAKAKRTAVSLKAKEDSKYVSEEEKAAKYEQSRALWDDVNEAEKFRETAKENRIVSDKIAKTRSKGTRDSIRANRNATRDARDRKRLATSERKRLQAESDERIKTEKEKQREREIARREQQKKMDLEAKDAAAERRSARKTSRSKIKTIKAGQDRAIADAVYDAERIKIEEEKALQKRNIEQTKIRDSKKTSDKGQVADAKHGYQMSKQDNTLGRNLAAIERQQQTENKINEIKLNIGNLKGNALSGALEFVEGKIDTLKAGVDLRANLNKQENTNKAEQREIKESMLYDAKRAEAEMLQMELKSAALEAKGTNKKTLLEAEGALNRLRAELENTITTAENEQDILNKATSLSLAEREAAYEEISKKKAESISRIYAKQDASYARIIESKLVSEEAINAIKDLAQEDAQRSRLGKLLREYDRKQKSSNAKSQIEENKTAQAAALAEKSAEFKVGVHNFVSSKITQAKIKVMDKVLGAIKTDFSRNMGAENVFDPNETEEENLCKLSAATLSATKSIIDNLSKEEKVENKAVIQNIDDSYNNFAARLKEQDSDADFLQEIENFKIEIETDENVDYNQQLLYGVLKVAGLFDVDKMYELYANADQSVNGQEFFEASIENAGNTIIHVLDNIEEQTEESLRKAKVDNIPER